MNPEFTVFMVFGPTKGLPMGLWDINLRKQLTGAFYVGLLDGLGMGLLGLLLIVSQWIIPEIPYV